MQEGINITSETSRNSASILELGNHRNSLEVKIRVLSEERNVLLGYCGELKSIRKQLKDITFQRDKFESKWKISVEEMEEERQDLLEKMEQSACGSREELEKMRDQVDDLLDERSALLKKVEVMHSHTHNDTTIANVDDLFSMSINNKNSSNIITKVKAQTKDAGTQVNLERYVTPSTQCPLSPKHVPRVVRQHRLKHIEDNDDNRSIHSRVSALSFGGTFVCSDESDNTFATSDS